MTADTTGAVLAGRLEADLQRLRDQIAEDPLRNPVRELSHRLSRDLEAGRVSTADIGNLIAYLDANPGNQALADWLDAALATFDDVYSPNRPGFLEGYAQLKEAIKPWGT